MSTLGNGDGSSGNGDPPEGLPDLPPEWGTIVIPDDASELAAEAATLRRELRRQRRRGASPMRVGAAPAPSGLTALRVPLIIMAAAVLATLISLFVVTWPSPQGRPTAQRTMSGGGPTSRTLPALDLIDADGAVVSLRGLLPAVIVLTNGCDCTSELASAVSAAPPGVAVVEVTSGRSAVSPVPGRPSVVASAVRRLADPASELQGLIPTTPPAGTAAALLVARSGEIVRILPNAMSVRDHPTELAQLASR